MHKAVLFALAIIGLASCSPKMYFTDSTYNKLKSNEIDLKKVQFYNSEDIVLIRQVKKEDIDVTDGKVKYEDGRYIEEIIIKRGTPGVFRSQNTDNTLMISFEPGKQLPFILTKNNNPNRGSIYRVGYLQWKTDKGVIPYGEHKYSIVRGKDAALLVKENVLVKTERKTRVAEGVKVD